MPNSAARPLRRASYREAVRWIAANEDTDWLDNPYGQLGDQPALSVTAALVVDLFGVEPDRFIADLRREVARLR